MVATSDPRALALEVAAPLDGREERRVVHHDEPSPAKSTAAYLEEIFLMKSSSLGRDVDDLADDLAAGVAEL